MTRGHSLFSSGDDVDVDDDDDDDHDGDVRRNRYVIISGFGSGFLAAVEVKSNPYQIVRLENFQLRRRRCPAAPESRFLIIGGDNLSVKIIGLANESCKGLNESQFPCSK